MGLEHPAQHFKLASTFIAPGPQRREALPRGRDGHCGSVASVAAAVVPRWQMDRLRFQYLKHHPHLEARIAGTIIHAFLQCAVVRLPSVVIATLTSQRLAIPSDDPARVIHHLVI